MLCVIEAQCLKYFMRLLLIASFLSGAHATVSNVTEKVYLITHEYVNMCCCFVPVSKEDFSPKRIISR